MDNKNKNKQSEKNIPLYIKILIPILIVGAIAGIYFVKNKDTAIDDTEVNIQSGDVDDTSQSSAADDPNQSAVFDLHVTEAIDLVELKSYGLPIMIDFGADSCVPCKEMAPVLVKLNEELQGKAIILFVDVWKYQELSADYPVRVIPTQVFFDSNGEPFVPSESLNIPLTMYSDRVSNEIVFTTHEGGMTEEMILEVFKEMGVTND